MNKPFNLRQIIDYARSSEAKEEQPKIRPIIYRPKLHKEGQIKIPPPLKTPRGRPGLPSGLPQQSATQDSIRARNSGAGPQTVNRQQIQSTQNLNKKRNRETTDDLISQSIGSNFFGGSSVTNRQRRNRNTDKAPELDRKEGNNINPERRYEEGEQIP